MATINDINELLEDSDEPLALVGGDGRIIAANLAAFDKWGNPLIGWPANLIDVAGPAGSETELIKRTLKEIKGLIESVE